MKKLLLGILISMVFLLGGCGGERNNNTSDSIATENEEKQHDKFSIVEKNDLLGNDAVTINKREGFQRVSRQIFEKDDYTYFVEAIYDHAGGMMFKVQVSVLRNDKWVIKDKITDFSDEIGDTRSNGADRCIVEGFGFNDSTMFVMTESEFLDYRSLDSTVVKQIHRITFGQDGVAYYKKILDKTEAGTEDLSYFVVNSLDKTYILEQIATSENDTLNFLTEDLKELHSVVIDTDNYPNKYRRMSTLRDGIFYFGKGHNAHALDLEAKDFIWKSNGAKMEFKWIDSNYVDGYDVSGVKLHNVNSGFYIITSKGAPQSYDLIYSKLEDGYISTVDSIEIPSELSVEEVYLTVDEENVNVYTLVDKYKGKPALQKYVIPRID